MNSLKFSINEILKYNLYLFPILIIMGNAAINSAMILVSFVYLLNCFVKKEVLFSDTIEFKFFIYFYIYLIINSLFSEDVKSSLIRSAPYIKFFIFVLLYKDFIEKKKNKFEKIRFFLVIYNFYFKFRYNLPKYFWV